MTGLFFTNTGEVGEMSEYGIVYESGHASLEPPEDYDDSASDVLDWFLATISEHIEAIRAVAWKTLLCGFCTPWKDKKTGNFRSSPCGFYFIRQRLDQQADSQGILLAYINLFQIPILLFLS